jgi:hypothetical protein
MDYLDQLEKEIENQETYWDTKVDYMIDKILDEKENNNEYISKN